MDTTLHDLRPRKMSESTADRTDVSKQSTVVVNQTSCDNNSGTSELGHEAIAIHGWTVGS